jgi:hypothetical protein
MHPVLSMACRCGAREEIKEARPASLNCYLCKGRRTMLPYVPGFAPPLNAGRVLTAAELASLQ